VVVDQVLLLEIALEVQAAVHAHQTVPGTREVKQAQTERVRTVLHLERFIFLHVANFVQIFAELEQIFANLKKLVRILAKLPRPMRSFAKFAETCANFGTVRKIFCKVSRGFQKRMRILANSEEHCCSEITILSYHLYRSDSGLDRRCEIDAAGSDACSVPSRRSISAGGPAHCRAVSVRCSSVSAPSAAHGHSSTVAWEGGISLCPSPLSLPHKYLSQAADKVGDALDAGKGAHHVVAADGDAVA
jgi:hypothetical protein